MIDWSIDAVSFGNCNCDYFCPCQFERRPNNGNCRGFEVGRIERGHFGDVRLDGLCYALLYAWPGAIYEGSGAMQAIIDERADAAQRQRWRRCCTAARRRKQRPTGGFITPCRRPCTSRSSRRSHSRWTSSGAWRASIFPAFCSRPAARSSAPRPASRTACGLIITGLLAALFLLLNADLALQRKTSACNALGLFLPKFGRSRRNFGGVAFRNSRTDRCGAPRQAINP